MFLIVHLLNVLIFFNYIFNDDIFQGLNYIFSYLFFFFLKLSKFHIILKKYNINILLDKLVKKYFIYKIKI